MSIKNSDSRVSAGAPSSNSDDEAGQQPGAPQISAEEYAAYMQLVPADPVLKPIEDKSWEDDLIYVTRINRKTKEEFKAIEPKSQNNIYLMTRHSYELRGLFILNEFSQRKMVVQCPPWENAEKFRPRDVRDDDYPRICMYLEKMGMVPSKEKVIASVEAICHDRSFHPVKKYFRSLKWDGKPRLGTWLSKYLGAKTDNEIYLAGVGTKWMVAGVARVFQPGCKFDHMLVLEGNTDIGKSKALKTLSTFHGEAYFYDGMTFSKIGDKDTMQNIQGFLIIEFPELSQLYTREVEEVKQWITMQEDRGRKPYGREPVTFPRQFLLAGTTNNTEYLKDPTGNKRFWPVMCGGCIDFNALERDVPQLWAEAVHLYRSGVKWWIPENDPLIVLSRQAQAKRMITHHWEEAVLEYIYGKNFVTVNEILMKKIEIPLAKIKRSDQMDVAAILKIHGWRSGRRGNQKGWESANFQESLENMEDIKV